jgi:large subunit ribosomal protein L18
MKKSRNNSRRHRKRRIRAKIFGSATVPRLCVFRSNVAIYAQLIDDESGKTLASEDSRSLKAKAFDIEAAKKVGEKIAEKAKKQKISQAVFDRGGYRYHGKVKALAEGAREGGIKI